MAVNWIKIQEVKNKIFGFGKGYEQCRPGFYIYCINDGNVIIENEDLDHLKKSDVEKIVLILNGGKKYQESTWKTDPGIRNTFVREII